MNRILRLALAMLAPTVLVIFFAVTTYKPGLPGQAGTLLQSYLRYQASTSQSTMTVQQIVEAGRPGSLTPQISRAAFGCGIFYTLACDSGTNSPTSQPTVTPLFAELTTAQPITPLRQLAGGGARGGLLPYPPAEVWCVVVRRAGQTQPGLVFLAQHQDLYFIEWVVHEPTAQTLPELNASLAAVGCNVTLQP